jgi:hypothetical protein
MNDSTQRPFPTPNAARVQIETAREHREFVNVVAFVLLDVNGVISFSRVPELTASSVVAALRQLANELNQEG